MALAAASMAYGGLLGAFALGVLTRRVSQAGAIVGMTAGVGTVVVIWAAARSAVAWPWFVFIGLVVTVAVGSFFRKPR